MRPFSEKLGFLSIWEVIGEAILLALLPVPILPTNASLEKKEINQQTISAVPFQAATAREPGYHETAAPPGPFSAAGAGDSTRCFLGSVPPSTCGRLLTSCKAGLFNAEGGLYAPRFCGPPAPGIPTLRVGSICGLTKLPRFGPGAMLLPC